MSFYIDTSALTKLVVLEPESVPLHSWLGDSDRKPVGCNLVRTELIRAVRRVAPERMLQARAVLETVTLTAVTTSIFESAGRLEPAVLRSLDAIHLAAALDLGDDLEGLVTYDDRLGAAAHSAGISIFAPR